MDEPLRVLCVFSTLDRGGAESMCMNLYRHIDRQKIQFDFVKHTVKEGAFENEILALGGKIFQAPRFKGYNLFQYSKWWQDHLMNHPEHHIIHGHYFTISPIYFNIAHKMERITIGHIHASAIHGVGKNFLVKLIERKADYCLACSVEAGKWAYPHRKFHVLKNALEIEKFSFKNTVREEYRKKFGLEKNLVLGTVANFSMVKNPFGLLEIFRLIHESKPESKLLWVGDGKLRWKIEERIKKYSIEDCVLLFGVREDVAELLQCMDCFLLPSINEGLPVSVIEAQAAGLPCFISDTVTREVDLTGLCQFLPIDNYEIWKNEVLKTDIKRENAEEFIKQSGYDIKQTSRWLQNFYLKKMNMNSRD